jgi:hypothetical protein
MKFVALGGDEWVDVRWPDVVHLEAVDPVPAFVLHRAGGLRQPFTPGGDDEDEFAARCEEVFERAARAGVPIDRGWLDHPRVEWEPVDALPPEGGDGGAYRGSSETVLARRGAPSSSEALLMWLLKRERDLAVSKQLVLTDERLYVERFDDSIWRMPRSTLRRARRTRSGDLVCTFGRDTLFVIAGRAGCPVTDALEAQLAEE